MRLIKLTLFDIDTNILEDSGHPERLLSNTDSLQNTWELCDRFEIVFLPT